jgi:RNA polymerase-binding transcription factor DksA
MRHLTAGQHALLETALEQRLSQLDRRLAEHLGGSTRAEHASAVLAQDGDDAPQRDHERVIDLAIGDRDTVALGEVSAALARLRDAAAGGYGLCTDCDTEIPFDRLKVEPWALRCVPCQTVHEHDSAT